MRSEHIDELICNAQIIRDKSTEVINFLLDRETLNFEEIRDIYGKLEIITGKSIASNVFIEISIAETCFECGGEDVYIDWDKGLVECQTCQCKRFLKPVYKLSEFLTSN